LGHELIDEIAKMRFMVRRLRKFGAKRSVSLGLGAVLGIMGIVWASLDAH
jgi:hypothetical protein